MLLPIARKYLPGLTVVALTGFSVRAVEPNYVRTRTHHPDNVKITTTSYSDGLGRALQNQVKINDPAHSGKSIISGQTYDDAGRPHKSIIPFVHDIVESYLETDLVTAAKATPHRDDAPYSEVTYYSDPLQRVRKTGAPGVEYTIDKHGTETWYTSAGSPTDFIPCNKLNNNEIDGELSDRTSGSYFLTINKDPDGLYSQNIIDARGNTRATWSHPKQNGCVDDKEAIIAEYDYDAMDRIKTEDAPGDLIGNTTYEYNTLSQMTEKTTPDAGKVTYEYEHDLLMSVENARMREENEKLRYKYDAHKRTTQVYVRNTDDDTEYPKIRNFYDHPGNALDFVRPHSEKLADILDPNVAGTPPFNGLSYTRGRVVVTIAYGEKCGPRATGDESDPLSGCSDVIIEAYSYDRRGNIAAKYKKIPAIEELQVVTYNYDSYQGKLLTSTHYYGGIDNIEKKVVRRYTYDRDARLKNVALNGKTAVEYQYDELGRTVAKDYYNREPGTVAHRIVYDLDSRDALKKIAAGKPGADGKNDDFFTQNLYYHDSPSWSNSSAGYNGNISATEFTRNASRNRILRLGYKYDDVNRLEEVNHATPEADDVSFSGSYEYDEIGRFTKKSEGTATLTDYNYGTRIEYSEEVKTSRLTRVGDIHGAAVNYVYAPDGALVFDRSKKMGIVYDYRNLPVEFRFYTSIPADAEWDDAKTLNNRTGVELVSLVKMLYDADGNRVLKQVFTP